MNLLKFASIDIGSNAVRLLFVNVIENGSSPSFKRSSMIRVPVRLGDDAFETGYISEGNQERLLLTMKAFSHLMKVQNVINYRACATSAMRDSSNRKEIVKKIKDETGINIEIISGKNEADTIFSQSSFLKDRSKNYLFVDLGGGSAEITFFSKGMVAKSQTFNIGTIRLIKKKVKKKEKENLKIWLKGLTNEYSIDAIIGSGGNINKYFKLSGKKEGKPLSYYHLLELYDNIDSYSYNDRIKILGLNPDRADVIIPAGEVFLNIMKWTNIKKIYIPRQGLSDGIVKQLYAEYKKG